MSPLPRCHALIVAAGRGSRFGGSLPKQYVTLGDQSVLRRAASVFAAHPRIAGIRVVIRAEDRETYDAAMSGLPLLEPTVGADERQRSVLNGLISLADYEPDWVLIHDGARPFVSAELIDRLLDALEHHPGAIPAVPINDTVKYVDADGSLIEATMDRSRLRRAQTPQAFHYQPIVAAHREAAGRPPLTDDAAVAEQAGLPVRIVDGEEENMKVTTSTDIHRAESILGGIAPIGHPETRIGFGYDVHRFSAGSQVILFGIAIAHTARLAGHSDADVGLHAITDAILGAIGRGDIGQHFPPSDPQWEGADSAVFLAHAATLARQAGGTIVNVDATAICERPKVGPYRRAMQTRVAEILGISSERVNIKATTTERLGFTGRSEGIAAQAVATVRMP